MWALSLTLAPLESVVRFIGGLPCAIAGPLVCRPTLLRNAVVELTAMYISVGPVTTLGNDECRMSEFGA